MRSLYLLQFGFFTCLTAQNWNYNDQASWPAKYCNGSKQSPVNIVTKNLPNMKDKIKPLEFSPAFRTKFEANIINDDYTVSVMLADPSQAQKLTVSRGGLAIQYTFLLFQFHWPSEHKINSKGYPLEIFLIFYATKYENAGNAIPHEDGFLLITGFFQISNQDNPIFDNILNTLPRVACNVGDPVPLKNPIILKNFLPLRNTTYYFYHGSVSKPICDEIVTFMVFETPSFISQSQLNKLKRIRDKNGDLVTRNNRNIQPMNKRGPKIGRKVLLD